MKKTDQQRRTLLAAGLGVGAYALSPLAFAADPGIKKDKIIIGAYLPLQSGVAAGATQVRDGADAYFRHINETGGIHGRKIEWIVENDSYNPQQALAVAKKLVDREGVFAIVSTLGTATNLAVMPYLNQRGVPLINPIGGSAKFNDPTDPNVFGLLPVGQKIGEAMVLHAVESLKAKRVAVFFQNDPFGKDPRDGAAEALQKRGLQVVAEASYAPSDVDVSAQVNALRAANPDVVLLSCITKHGALFTKEAQRLGWKPAMLASNTMGDPVTLDLGGDSLEGLQVILFTALETMDTPAVKEANALVTKYHPQTKPGYWSYLGIAGAKVFVDAAKKAGPDLTRAKLMQAMYGFGNYQPGVVPPVNWSKASHGGPTTFGWAVWKGGKLTVTKGW
jgi:ABC-type branched-subunit amino acid transport system substrate-binding protein